jgi:CAAX prenyl protease-like protein
MSDPSSASMNDRSASPLPWLPYVAPMATFLVLTSAEGWLPRVEGGPSPTWYATAYAVKVAVVAAVAWACRATWRDLVPRPGTKALGLAIAIGLGIAALWVGLDGLYPRFGIQGTRAAFNPYTLPPTARAGFLVVRLFGLVALVPLVEELFWRSFLMRWVIDPDFDKVPIGRVTPVATAITAGLFAAAHPEEWLPALITGLAWAWLLHRTRSVAACVVSHVIANLGLGAYVLARGAWKFW